MKIENIVEVIAGEDLIQLDMVDIRDGNAYRAFPKDNPKHQVMYTTGKGAKVALCTEDTIIHIEQAGA